MDQVGISEAASGGAAVADAQALRAMAHPARLRIIYELHARGTARGTDLAESLRLPSNQVSYHLGLLAKYGLIEEAPEERKTRRDRFWRLTAEGRRSWSPDALASQPGGRETATRWKSRVLERVYEALDSLYDPDAREDSDLIRSTNNVPMLLTRDEADEVADEVFATLTRWAEHGRRQAAAGDAEGRSTYVMLTFFQPESVDSAPEEP